MSKLQEKFEAAMLAADSLAQQRARDRELAVAWEAAVLAGEIPPDMDWAAIDKREWKHPAHRRCILVASAITPGAAEAYGWRRSWIVLAVGDGEDKEPDEEKAYRYAKRWARRRGLRLEGCPYWESVANVDKIAGHLELPQRFDAGAS